MEELTVLTDIQQLIDDTQAEFLGIDTKLDELTTHRDAVAKSLREKEQVQKDDAYSVPLLKEITQLKHELSDYDKVIEVAKHDRREQVKKATNGILTRLNRIESKWVEGAYDRLSPRYVTDLDNAAKEVKRIMSEWSDEMMAEQEAVKKKRVLIETYIEPRQQYRLSGQPGTSMAFKVQSKYDSLGL